MWVIFFYYLALEFILFIILALANFEHMDIVVHEPLHSYMGSQAKHMVIKRPMAWEKGTRSWKSS
jgi:hypothetical protein